MEITDELLECLEELSKLRLNKKEREETKDFLKNVVDSLKIFNDFDIKHTFNLEEVKDMKNVFRDDVVESSFNREDLLINSPSAEKGYFKVPKTIE